MENGTRKTAPKLAWPGGTVGGVPAFNPANVAHVLESNGLELEASASPYTSTRYADEMPEADFYGE